MKFKITNFAHGAFLGRGEARRALREGKVSPRLKEQSYLNPVRKFLSTDSPCAHLAQNTAANKRRPTTVPNEEAKTINLKAATNIFLFGPGSVIKGEHDESSRLAVSPWVCVRSFGRCRMSKFWLLVYLGFF